MRLTLPQLPAEWGRVALYAMAALLSAPGIFLTAQEVWAQQPYWVDEAYSMGILAVGSLGHTISILMTDSHPPMYYLALAAWTWVFGDGLVATRALSFCATLGALALLWWRGPVLFSRPTLAIATLWLCTHWLFIFRMYQVRMYALVLLGGVWLTLSFARLWTARQEPSSRELAWCCFGAFFVAMLHYPTMAFACSALLLLLYRCRRNPWAWAMIGGVGTVCLLWSTVNYLHWMTGPRAQDLTQHGVVGAATMLYRVGVPSAFGARSALLGGDWIQAVAQWLATAAVAVATLLALRSGVRKEGSWRSWWQKNRGMEWAPVRSLLQLMAVFLLAMIIVHDALLPLFLPWAMVAAMPAMGLCIGAALHAVWGQRYWVLCALALLLGGTALEVTLWRWDTTQSPGFDRDGMQAMAQRWRAGGSSERIYSRRGFRKRSFPGMASILAGGGLSGEGYRIVYLSHEDMRHLIPPFYAINAKEGWQELLHRQAEVHGWRVEQLAPDSPSRREEFSFHVTED